MTIEEVFEKIDKGSNPKESEAPVYYVDRFVLQMLIEHTVHSFIELSESNVADMFNDLVNRREDTFRTSIVETIKDLEKNESDPTRRTVLIKAYTQKATEIQLGINKLRSLLLEQTKQILEILKSNKQE